MDRHLLISRVEVGLVAAGLSNSGPEVVRHQQFRKTAEELERVQVDAYNVRIEGTRIKHSMGKSTIKLYDKFGTILRIETTTLDITFLRHYRDVGQKDGHKTLKYAPMKKGIYSLGPLREALTAANRRHLEFI